MPEFDFFTQLKAEMVQTLPTRSMRERNRFCELGIEEQAWRFMNWQSRLVHPHPRQINKAIGFDDLPAVRANREAVEALLGRIARGNDVNGHLSHDIRHGFCFRAPSLKDGPDFDLLLNEWGIHHLHLDQSPGKGGFRARSSDLLYVVFGRGVAYVVAAARHGVWTDRRLICATVQSWPDQGLFLELKGVLPGRDWYPSEHKRLREVGITTAAMADDRCWISGVTGGLSEALVSVRMSKESARLLYLFGQASKNSDHLELQLRNNANLNSLVWPANANIVVRWLHGIDRYCFGFVETTTGSTVLVETA